ncbi:MAG: hypothetical protein MI923_21420 [Phycisphaerales bacterium]|nr:hypothetical protein [Phycisphaerales bacterium]
MRDRQSHFLPSPHARCSDVMTQCAMVDGARFTCGTAGTSLLVKWKRWMLGERR